MPKPLVNFLYDEHPTSIFDLISEIYDYLRSHYKDDDTVSYTIMWREYRNLLGTKVHEVQCGSVVFIFHKEILQSIKHDPYASALHDRMGVLFLDLIFEHYNGSFFNLIDGYTVDWYNRCGKLARIKELPLHSIVVMCTEASAEILTTFFHLSRNQDKDINIDGEYISIADIADNFRY